MEQKTSISDYEQFKFSALDAVNDDIKFKQFKTHPDFTPILEHVNYEQGLGYIEYIKNSSKFNIADLISFKENDIYGGSILESYELPFGKISPSTLRYIKVLLELEEMFGNLDNFKIIEIGGGYGGQSLLIQKYFTNIDYTIVDLPEVGMLANKYLGVHNLTHTKIYNVDDIVKPVEYDLVISNYAISECSKFVQDIYISNIIKSSKRGYITYNHISHLFNIDSYTPQEFQNILNCKKKEEIPATGANTIFYW